MALSDLKVFSEKTYSTFQELLDYNVELFNGATRGGLVLTSGTMQGDNTTEAFWARITNLVKRRNVYADANLTTQALTMKERSKVKVAAGTYPIDISESMFTWILKSPDEASAVIGKQLAQDAMNDMVSVAIKAFMAATGAQATNLYDGTAGIPTLGGLMSTARKLGDRADDIACWLMHSKSMFDIWGANLANTANLFDFGTVKILQDGFGRPFVVADHPSLVNLTPTPDVYSILGFTSGGVVVEGPNNWKANEDTRNGTENIKTTYQAEWTYNLSLKGYTWDVTNGGACPNDAALATATNWDKSAASYKDLAGVMGNFQ